MKSAHAVWAQYAGQTNAMHSCRTWQVFIHAYLGGRLQGLTGEDQMSTLAQIFIMHALGDLGNGIIPRQSLRCSMCDALYHGLVLLCNKRCL